VPAGHFTAPQRCGAEKSCGVALYSGDALPLETVGAIRPPIELPLAVGPAQSPAVPHTCGPGDQEGKLPLPGPPFGVELFP